MLYSEKISDLSRRNCVCGVGEKRRKKSSVMGDIIFYAWVMVMTFLCCEIVLNPAVRGLIVER